METDIRTDGLTNKTWKASCSSGKTYLRKTRPERIEIFDFKSKDGQNLFKDSTSQTKEFSECFNGENSLLFQIEKWRKILRTHCKKSFKKIRIRKNKKKPVKKAIAVLIDKRNKILHEDSEENLKEIDEISRELRRIRDTSSRFQLI